MESGKIIVVANQKGGVAKTSTVRNLSYALAEMGKKVLVVDFDPQYNLTTSFGVLPTQAPYNTGTLITNLLLDESLPDTNEFIQKIGSVDLIPSSRSLTVAEANLLMTPDSNDYLAALLNPLRLSYDYIIVDTNPSLGSLTINALTAADEVIIPIDPELFALTGLQALVDTIKKIKRKLNPGIEIGGILFTKCNKRTNLYRRTYGQVTKAFQSLPIFNCQIPYTVKVGDANSYGMSVMELEQANPASLAYPDIPAVYVDTGLEYPELRDFVKTKDNVIWLRPRYPFTQILEKYGYPIISKEISDVINGARKGQPYRLARINGELLDKNGKKSIYNCENYKYLLDAPFKISARCCYHMKKAPLNKFERQSGRHPITGVLACESKLREQSWIKFGCNGFERQRPLSQPLAFWLEEDILRYLKMTGIPYAPIYGDIVESRKKNGTPILKTTGVSRSGCMYCMYGVHLEHEPNRFQLMQVTHPQQYDYCINKLGCGAVLDYIGVPYRNQQLEVDHC